MAMMIEALNGVTIDTLDGCAVNGTEGLQLLGPNLMGLGAVLTDSEIQAMAKELVTSGLTANQLAGLLSNYDHATQQKLGASIIAAGGNAATVSFALQQQQYETEGGPYERRSVWGLVGGIAITASAAVSAYHGYKRNDSVGWAIWWFLMGGLFPVVTPVIALAQNFGQPKD